MAVEHRRAAVPWLSPRNPVRTEQYWSLLGDSPQDDRDGRPWGGVQCVLRPPDAAVAMMLGWHRRRVCPPVEVTPAPPLHRSRGDPVAAESGLMSSSPTRRRRRTNLRGIRIMLTMTRARQNQQKQPPRSDCPPGRLITVSEAAKLLRLSRRTIERLVGRGDLPFFELPIRGGLRFDIKELEAWLAQRHRRALEGR